MSTRRESLPRSRPLDERPLPPDIADLIAGWRLSLQATGRPPKTLVIYCAAVEKVHRVIKACRRGPVPSRIAGMRPSFALFLETGMRLGEMAGLRVDGVDLEGERLIVTGAAARFVTAGCS